MATDEDFFTKIESELNVSVPPHLKKLLTLHGFANNISLGDITESDIVEIERFTRSELKLVVKSEEVQDYLGIFGSNIKNFLIFGGEKKLLFKIKEHVKTRQNFQIKFNQPKCNKKTTNNAKDSSLQMAITNMGEEKLQLIAIVKKNIKDSLKQLDESKQKLVLSKLNQIEYNCQTEDSGNLSCMIDCVLCTSKLKVQKYRKAESMTSRWLIGNYKQHFLKHANDDTVEMKKTKSTPANTIYNYMASTTSKTSENSEPLTKQLEPSTSRDNSHVLSSVVSQHSSVKVGKKRSLSKSTESGEVLVQKSKIIRLPDSSESSEIDDPDFPEGGVDDDLETICPANSKIPSLQKDSINASAVPRVTEVIILKEANASKWSQEKYSRQRREQRKREKEVENQPLITNYLQHVDEISELLRENKELKNRLLDELPKMLPSNETFDRSQGANEDIQSFLRLLQKTAVLNKNKSQNNKYDPDLMQFCTYLYIIGGRLIYETLHANLKKSIPCMSTIQRNINNSAFITEGSLRFEELSMFLSKRNLPKVVWLSEDATGITGRIQYCTRTDSIIGFVSPFDDNGLTKKDCFPANSVQIIQKYFLENDRAKYAYVVIAQSPIDKSASFCLNVFGTDNRFTNEDVARRWNTMKQEAEKFGIRILGFSSDGDTRLMKTMRNFSNFQNAGEEPKWEWFQMSLTEGDICVQDTVHIATKMRTRILNKSVTLQLGAYEASTNHLEDVVNGSSKDKHLLTISDLKPDDKMNFRAAEKITSPLVEKVLKDLVVNSEGTVAFLKLTRLILQAFLNKNETSYDRIFNIWYCVFFLRIWRNWLHESSGLSVTKNFISLNCYLCFELNAHAMIKLVRLYRDNPKLSEECMFTPWLFSSQPCEQIFRATRSLTSTFSTVVNFSIYDILRRLNKIQHINNVLADLSQKVVFPREAKHSKLGKDNLESKTSIYFVNDEEIEQCVMKALNKAKITCQKLGMEISSDQAWQKVNIFNTHTSTHRDEHESDAQGEDTFNNDESEMDLNICNGIEESNVAMEDRLNDLSTDLDDETGNSPPSDIVDLQMMELNDATKPYGGFLNMTDVGSEHKSERSFLKIKVGKDVKTIKKSSLCWLLDEKSNKLSADRLLRVRGSTDISNILRKNPNPTENIATNIMIALENYYAVFYDNAWYIGRIIGESHHQCTKEYEVKFLRETFGQFQWPKPDDIQLVEECYIFFGPINMMGSSPMLISQAHRDKIIKKYREMKRRLNSM